MSIETQLTSWYAVFVKTGDEDNVKERLAYRFGENARFIVPKKTIKERKNGVWTCKDKILFPGYVLINGQLSDEDYELFKNVPGLYSLLIANCRYLHIPEEEIEIIARLTGDDDLIAMSDVIFENDIVTVVDGPLLGLEGIIVKLDKRKGRAKVKLQFLGEERTVDLGINILEPTD